MARARTRTPASALLRTGPQAATLPAAMPEGKGGEQIKVEPWGANNLLPQEILKVLYDSGTATTCVERLGLFIGGAGFANPATAKAMANPYQTFNQLLSEAAETAAVGFGVAYIVRYTYGGEVGEIYAADVDCVRREKDGERFVLNPKLATGKMPTDHNEVYLPYDPLASQQQISEQVIAAAGSEYGYWGHLLFSFARKMGRKRYPIPDWWAAKEAVQADAETPKYDHKQFVNGFYPDAIITVVGAKYNDVEDERATPAAEAGDEVVMVKSPDRAALEKDLKALKGSSSEASILLNTVETENEKPQIDWVDKGPNSKGLTDATNRIEGRVYRRMSVPPVLCGVAEPGVLGSNQQIVNSIQLFGLTVNPRRALCVEPLMALRPELDFTVAPLNPVDYIDPAVAAVMTDDELRATRSLAPLAEVEQPRNKPTPKPRPKA
jgi:hypothetical protein